MHGAFHPELAQGVHVNVAVSCDIYERLFRELPGLSRPVVSDPNLTGIAAAEDKYIDAISIADPTQDRS